MGPLCELFSQSTLYFSSVRHESLQSHTDSQLPVSLCFLLATSLPLTTITWKHFPRWDGRRLHKIEKLFTICKNYGTKSKFVGRHSIFYYVSIWKSTHFQESQLFCFKTSGLCIWKLICFPKACPNETCYPLNQDLTLRVTSTVKADKPENPVKVFTIKTL